MPKIKDTAKWWAMMSPKIIRQRREEQEVAPFVTIPKPEISTKSAMNLALVFFFYLAIFKAVLRLIGLI